MSAQSKTATAAAPNEPVLLPELSDTGVLTLTLNRPQVSTRFRRICWTR